MGSDDISRGRVEHCYEGSWYSVCAHRSIINSTSLLDHDQSLPQDGLPDIEIYGYVI